MPRYSSDEIRSMSREERAETLRKLNEEYLSLRGESALGGAPQNPGSIRATRRLIARVLTIQREQGEL